MSDDDWLGLPPGNWRLKPLKASSEKDWDKRRKNRLGSGGGESETFYSEINKNN